MQVTGKKGEVLIKVEGVSKKFCRNLKRSLYYGVTEIAFGMLRKKANSHLRKDEFWAVKEVSFEVRRGECLALIGHNGAGKSTLLKMLNGLIRPDDGRIEMHGKIGALIELGAGFNPLLTGRENVYNNGAVLGFSKQEIDKKFDEIVAFAELEEFIDMPVQNYSSGMKVRLGFAVAAQMEPDILIIDEVLAVGDLGFRLKCFNVLDRLIEKSAVVFVSHQMQQISRICSSALLMERGIKKIHSENLPVVIEQYYGTYESPAQIISFSKDIEIDEFKLTARRIVNDIPVIHHLDDLEVHMKVRIKEHLQKSVITLSVLDNEQRPVGICFDKKTLKEKELIATDGDFLTYKLGVKIPRINLSAGLYFFSFTMSEDFRSKPLIRLQSFSKFQVYSDYSIFAPIEFESEWK